MPHSLGGTGTAAPGWVRAPGVGASIPESSAPPSDRTTGLTDPSLIEQGGTYVLFSSGPGIRIERSTDLVHWQDAGQVFASIPAWARAKVPAATGFWAPDISFFAGQYHLYYAVSSYGKNRSVIGLATATTLDPADPSYGWTDRGEVLESRPALENFNAIDPNVATDSAGRPWLAFGSQWSGVRLIALDPQSGKPSTPIGAVGSVALASRPNARPIEAPFLFQRGGFWYLFVSFDACCQGVGSTYKIEVGRSTDLAGPYLDRTGKPLLRGGGTLVLGAQGADRGPGSNAILHDGANDWLVYQCYDANDGGRTKIRVRPLSWTADGWPEAGPPLS